MTRHRSTLAVAFVSSLVACAALAQGCQDATQIVVKVSTNLSCSSTAPAFEGGHLAVYRDATLVDGSEATLPKDLCKSGEIGTLTIVPGASGDGATVRVRAAAWLGAGVKDAKVKNARECFEMPGAPDCVVSTRSLRFIAHRSLTIPIFLDSACAGVMCPEKMTCGPGGVCIGEEEPVVPPTDAGPPVDAGGPPLVATKLYAGGDRTCADTKDGFYCWGSGFSRAPQRVADLDGSSKVAIGPDHYCAISGVGGDTLTCWGSNKSGQLGDANPLLVKNTISLANPPVESWTDVSVGSAHGCALGEGASIKKTAVICWGDQSTGQVDGTVVKSLSLPREVKTGDMGVALAPIRNLASAGATTCINAAIDPGFTCTLVGSCYEIFCWGANDVGQCGRAIGDNAPHAALSKNFGVPLSSPIALFGGTRHMIALSGGGAFGWGDSAKGQLLAVTDGGTTAVDRPIGLNGFASKISGAAAGDGYTCAIADGSVACQGATLLDATKLPKAAAIAGGRDHVCVLDGKGEIWCAGANNAGQLGVANDVSMNHVTM